jgi:hypothetical protein
MHVAFATATFLGALVLSFLACMIMTSEVVIFSLPYGTCVFLDSLASGGKCHQCDRRRSFVSNFSRMHESVSCQNIFCSELRLRSSLGCEEWSWPCIHRKKHSPPNEFHSCEECSGNAMARPCFIYIFSSWVLVGPGLDFCAGCSHARRMTRPLKVWFGCRRRGFAARDLVLRV